MNDKERANFFLRDSVPIEPPRSHYRTIEHDIKAIAVDYIIERKLDDGYLRNEAHRALIHAAIGVSMVERVTNSYVNHIGNFPVPATKFDTLLTLLPDSLQFGWMKPKFDQVPITKHYNVYTEVTLPNKLLSDNERRTYSGKYYTREFTL